MSSFAIGMDLGGFDAKQRAAEADAAGSAAATAAQHHHHHAMNGSVDSTQQPPSGLPSQSHAVGRPALIRDISLPSSHHAHSVSFSSTLQPLPSPKSTLGAPVASQQPPVIREHNSSDDDDDGHGPTSPTLRAHHGHVRGLVNGSGPQPVGFGSGQLPPMPSLARGESMDAAADDLVPSGVGVIPPADADVDAFGHAIARSNSGSGAAGAGHGNGTGGRKAGPVSAADVQLSLLSAAVQDDRPFGAGHSPEQATRGVLLPPSTGTTVRVLQPSARTLAQQQSQPSQPSPLVSTRTTNNSFGFAAAAAAAGTNPTYAGPGAPSPAPTYRLPFGAPHLGVVIPATPELMPRPMANLTPSQTSPLPFRGSAYSGGHVVKRASGPHRLNCLSHDMLHAILLYVGAYDVVRSVLRVNHLWRYVGSLPSLWSGPGGVLTRPVYFLAHPDVRAPFRFLEMADPPRAAQLAREYLTGLEAPPVPLLPQPPQPPQSSGPAVGGGGATSVPSPRSVSAPASVNAATVAAGTAGTADLSLPAPGATTAAAAAAVRPNGGFALDSKHEVSLDMSPRPPGGVAAPPPAAVDAAPRSPAEVLHQLRVAAQRRALNDAVRQPSQHATIDYALWQTATRGRGKSFYVAVERPAREAEQRARDSEMQRRRALADEFDCGVAPSDATRTCQRACSWTARWLAWPVATVAALVFCLLLALRNDGKAYVSLPALMAPLWVFAFALTQAAGAAFVATFHDPRPADPRDPLVLLTASASRIRTFGYDQRKTRTRFAVVRATLLLAALAPVVQVAFLQRWALAWDHYDGGDNGGFDAAILEWPLWQLVLPLLVLFVWLTLFGLANCPCSGAPLCTSMFDRTRVSVMATTVLWLRFGVLWYAALVVTIALSAAKLDALSGAPDSWFVVCVPLYVCHGLALLGGLAYRGSTLWEMTARRSRVPAHRLHRTFWLWLAANVAALCSELVVSASLDGRIDSAGAGGALAPVFVLCVVLPLCVRDSAELAVDFGDAPA